MQSAGTMRGIEVGDRRIQDGFQRLLRKALTGFEKVSERGPYWQVNRIPGSTVVLLVVSNPSRMIELTEHPCQKQEFGQPLFKVRVELRIAKQEGDPIGVAYRKL